jgi:hypothetical protein
MIVETLNDARARLRRVFFEGTGALQQGTAVCYNSDYGTATAADDSRDHRVEVPNQGNHLWFAGIVTQAYAANPAGQWITIAEPGSIVPVLVDGTVSAVGAVGGFIANHASANTDVGEFSATYNSGRGAGAVEFLQTRTGAGLALARVLEGPQVGGVEVFAALASTPVAPAGLSVVTRIAANTTLGALAAGTAVGSIKRFRIIGATANTVIMPVGTNLGSRQGTGASGPEQEQHVAFSNVVAPSGATQADTSIVLQWTGLHWRLVSTNAAQSGQFT